MTRWVASIHVYNLVAFLAVLGAIIALALAGERTDLAVVTGLVGILGSFKPWGSTPGAEGPTGTPSDPLSVAGAAPGATPVTVEEPLP